MPFCRRRDDCIGQSTTTTTMTIIILVFVLCHSPRLVTGFEPGFISPLENITVAAGRSAQFTCVVKHLGGHKVAWLRSDSKAILAIHTHMVTNNPRMSVSHNGHNSWTLEIDVVQRNDSGLYMCQINTEPMTSQVGVLNVVEAPDILYNETSNDTIVAEGASVTLRCEARGYPEPTVTWRREDGAPIVLRSHQTRIQTVEGNELELHGLTRTDMGAYLCIASNGIPSPVSKRIMVHVHFNPLVKVHDQIVTTRLGSTVTLQCTVEASPKSVNFWIKQGNGPGEEITINSPSGRYKISEDQENIYTSAISLTIIGVRESDLGNYTCSARNSYGTVKGTIQIEKLREIIPETTKSLDDEEEEDFRYRYESKQKYRNKNDKKHATIYQLWTSTTEAYGDEKSIYYHTPPSYKHQDNAARDKSSSGSSSTAQTESFFFPVNAGSAKSLLNFCTIIVIFSMTLLM